MNTADLLTALQGFFVAYFLCLNGSYIALNLVALFTLARHIQDRDYDLATQVAPEFAPPVSLLVPAHNEAATVAATVRSLLQLDYPAFEVVVINDGSTDATLQSLVEAFDLVPFPEAYRVRLATRPVRGLWRSTRHPNLRVVDKANGGKSDALNAGLNAARHPLVCTVDADSILDRKSLLQVARPFMEDPDTVACGGTIRVANGCAVQGGFLVKAGLPRNLLALFQVVEYLRAFLFGRLGWAPLNALLVISGAFGLFRKDTVIAAGGYRTDTVGEDMELVVRLHRWCRSRGRPYRIAYVPDPICWTEVPETAAVLFRQRVRWQRGLWESLVMNSGLFLNPRAGAVGLLAYPFFAVFEWLGPLVEVAGYVLVGLAWALGLLSHEAFLAFLAVAVGLGVLLSLAAIFMDVFAFRVYPRTRDTLILALAAVAENLGYRQLTAFWRLWGILAGMLRMRARWGSETRMASWNRAS
ncbi:glycosyltransferase family 2 protein [Dissulfurirhabdus thermomarina]|uniref:Glycosyltransferase family 2 protein n=1 Tax=Dissulfurirhabdus thermomarina TaxID=1765737 RepID=A0A6N9TKI4_DISTH|nr:glycosyltransferase [Dissulfurirhabdus thermomarina]NDY41619.1 glycosyltransferase family 2 protein [Dissulfurirhabdus thermomarina]NMX23338.1 glycosyltransferase family 2 protein [Dissulfurirhabdus thermomarina]